MKNEFLFCGEWDVECSGVGGGGPAVVVSVLAGEWMAISVAFAIPRINV